MAGNKVLKTLRANSNKIYVSTDTPRALYKDVNDAAIVDLMVTGGTPNYTFRNLRTGTMFTLLSDLTQTFQMPGGSTSAEAQVIVSNSNENVGQGYNSNNCAFSDGVNCPTSPYNKDFFVHTANLSDDLNRNLNLIANVQYGANYDLLSEAYGQTFTITIDSQSNSLGSIASATAMLTALNALNKGLWVRNGNKFTVNGIRSYGDINRTTGGATTYSPTGGTWIQQLEWQMQLLTSLGVPPKHLAFGLENLLSAYDAVWENSDEGYGGATYRTKVQSTINSIKAAYPATMIYVDSALVGTVMQKRDTNWDARMDVTGSQKGTAMTNVDGGRIYFSLNNFAPTNFSASDYAANLAILNDILNVQIPARIKNFKSYLNGKKMGIWQWGLRNPTDPNNIDNTMLALLWIAKFYKFMVDWNYNDSNFISYASYQGLKAIWQDNDSVKNEYYALRLNGKMFQNTPDYYQIRIGLGSGIDGYCVKDGGVYRILIFNETGVAKTQSGINVVDTQYTSVTRESYSAAALNSTTITYTAPVVESGTINIPAYSINLITITTS